ncbi:MAG TPA: calcium-binding protein, partial [Pirellulaceae bacterium]|nr:calcium-binding protein [Pirellulaceae bacterium]
EGQNIIGFTVITTDASGNATFNLNELTQPGTVFTATASRVDQGFQPIETSEFGPGFVLQEPPPPPQLVCEVTTLNEPGVAGTATLTDDADNPGDGVLIVTGTAGNDVIVVEPRPVNTAQLRVKRNGQLLGIFDRSAVQHIVIFGLAGNDVIVVNATLSQSATLLGDKGNDRLFGGRGNDQLDGGDGNDRLFGGSGDDTLCGGNGNDVIVGGLGNDLVGGDAGNDVINGDVGDDLLLGGDGNDVLDGAVGNDRLYGQAGNDTLIGGVGNNILVGGDGNDVLVARYGRNILIGGTGKDTLYGNAADDILVAGSTAHDEDDAALQAVLTEWTSGNSYEDRVDNIRNGTGANGAFVLDDTTVFDDGVKDTLFGSAARDWFWIGTKDKIKDRAKNEFVN